MNENTSEVFKKICDIFQQELGVEPSLLNEKSSMEEIDLWDSFAHMNLIIAIEAEFNIRFDPTEVAQVNSIEDILLKVSAK